VTENQQITGREFIARALAQAGIDTIYTVAGGHFLPTYHEMGRLGAPRVIAARHEQGAGYMASGHALATGHPGVVFSGAPGPGATNLVTAVANANADSIPLLVLSAQVDRRYVHRNILQYCDNVALFEPFCKWSTQAVSIDELPNLLATGLQLAASGRPAPVHIAIPQNFQAEKAMPPVSVRPCDVVAGTPSTAQIDAVAAVLEGAKKPAILAGHGIVRTRASDSLEALAERLGAPVATSRSGIGSISTGHRAAVGMLGFYGTETARDSIAESDVVLVVGCALGEQTTFGWRPTLFAPEATIVHVDVDPAQVNRIYPADIGIVADAGRFLDLLLAKVSERPAWYERRPEPCAAQNDRSRGLSAADVMQALNVRAADEAFFSADIGNHRLWVCDQLSITHAGRLLQSCEFDAMGFSLPAAIGAKLAAPGGAKAVAISGDGGFVHTMGELAVAREYGLPLISVVFVDGALGILKHQAEEMYGEDHFVRLEPIGFAAVAEAFGVPARQVVSPEELGDALDWAFAADGPVMLAITIDPDEVFPPLRTKIEQRRRDLLGQG